MNFPLQNALADVQNTPDNRNSAIDRVGIKNIRHLINFKNDTGEVQTVAAVFNMYVQLAHDVKGTHMSRFVALLNEPKSEISLANFKEFLTAMITKLNAKTGEVEISFPYFVNKTAPVSGVKSLMDYDVTVTARLNQSFYDMTIKLLIPVTSLCPCSKKISDFGAHNQRSHVTVTLNLLAYIELEEIITLVEENSSSQLYSLLKREDEKYVTEYAYSNPKFVEDMVRDIALEFAKDDRIISYIVECENFESIHNHSAYAKIEG